MTVNSNFIYTPTATAVSPETPNIIVNQEWLASLQSAYLETIGCGIGLFEAASQFNLILKTKENKMENKTENLIHAIHCLEEDRFVRIGEWIFKKSVKSRTYGGSVCREDKCILMFSVKNALKGPLSYGDIHEDTSYCQLARHFSFSDKEALEVEILHDFEMKLAGK